MGISAPTRELAAIRGDDTGVLVDGSKPGSASPRFDPLGDLVVRRWWDAVRYMQSDLLQDASVEHTLGRCYRQRAGVYEPDEIALVDGIDIYVPATDMKCMAAEAWLRDMLINSIDMPFTVQPTPIPDLPERLRAKVLRDLKLEIAQTVGGDALATAQALAQMPTDLAEMVFGNMIAQYPGDLQDVAAKYKSAARSIAYEEALGTAKRMELLIKDQCVQMQFGAHLLNFFHDLVTYPAAIIKGPVGITRPNICWQGNRRVVRTEQTLGCYRVAVFDFKPSPDSPDTQRGTYVIEKTRMTKRSLAWTKGQKFWISDQVDRVLAEYGNRNRNWLVYGLTSNPEEAQQVALWSDDETIDSLEHHGIVSGRELRPYGISADDKTYYEAKIVVAGGRTLNVRVNGEPYMAQRPYHATSYEKMGDRFWNTCPVLKMRAVQRTINAAVRSQIRNMTFSCLTGDTIVYRQDRKGRAKRNSAWRQGLLGEVTLNQLWAAKQERKSNLTRQRLRSLDEKTGEFYGNKVLDIIDNGVRPVYRVRTANGYSIKATTNHRFLGDDGAYRVLEKFSVGDSIGVNGSVSALRKQCVDCGLDLRGGSLYRATSIRCHPCAIKVHSWNQIQAERALNNRDASPATARARKLVQAQKKTSCERCSTSSRLHLHHLDRDPLNCRPENLKTLCEPCHNWWHRRHDWFGDGRRHVFLDFDRIVSIEYVGEERVFDLAMAAPDHNFVANGFVNHNSGPTGEADVSRLQRYVSNLAEVQNITPYTLKLVDPDMMNGGRPAIQFHNVPQIIAPLQNTIAFYMKMLDDVSNIPAYAQGDTGLSGAGRTFRGFSAVFAQALKVFKVPVQNMDADVFEPFATALYNYNMTYSKDEGVKGDCKVYAKGSRGLLDREMEEQKAMDLIKIVAQITPAVAEVAPKETADVLKYSWKRAMQVLGVPIEAFSTNPEVDAALASSQQNAQGDAAPGTPIPAVSADIPSPG